MESGIAIRRRTALAVAGEDYIKRRNELIQAAAEVFKKKGFAATNIGDVAAHLDVDRASLYYYVESKEELFHEVVREAAEQNARRAEDIRDGEGTADEKIRALIKSLVESYGKHHPYLFVYIQEDMKRVAAGDAPWAKKMRAAPARARRRRRGPRTGRRRGEWGPRRCVPVDPACGEVTLDRHRRQLTMVTQVPTLRTEAALRFPRNSGHGLCGSCDLRQC